MAVLSEESLPIASETDIVRVRQVVRTKSVGLKFSLVEQTKIVTAASELARNTLCHGGGGAVALQLVKEEDKEGLRLIFEDTGPGIADVELALQDGYTTGSGMGLGLPGARRLANEFFIATKPGEGTKVMITKWRGR